MAIKKEAKKTRESISAVKASSKKEENPEINVSVINVESTTENPIKQEIKEKEEEKESSGELEKVEEPIKEVEEKSDKLTKETTTTPEATTVQTSTDVLKNEEEYSKLEEDKELSEDRSRLDDDLGSDDDSSGGKFRKIMYGIIGTLLFVGILLIVSYLSYQRGVMVGSGSLQNQEQSEMAKEEPTPTPEDEGVAPSSYTIEVLNGSGVSGAASSAKDLLEENGYSVISIGNADSTYEDTEIRAKDGVESSWTDSLSTLLSETYQMGETTTLNDSADADVIVIIGSESASSE